MRDPAIEELLARFPAIREHVERFETMIVENRETLDPDAYAEWVRSAVAILQEWQPEPKLSPLDLRCAVDGCRRERHYFDAEGVGYCKRHADELGLRPKGKIT